MSAEKNVSSEICHVRVKWRVNVRFNDTLKEARYFLQWVSTKSDILGKDAWKMDEQWLREPNTAVKTLFKNNSSTHLGD